jgi:uncharacterized protein (TIGR03083 family)
MNILTPAAAWIGALHSSSRRLRALVTELSDAQLVRPSFASGWSVAQVLSHLGSGAEICGHLVRRGLDGDSSAPRPEEIESVWERFDAMSASEQRAAWLEADERHLGMLDAIDPARHGIVQIPYFSGLLDLASYGGYRLSEQTIHGWDVAVALDPSARLPHAEAQLLWERIDLVASRFHNATALARLAPARIALELTDTGQRFSLHLTSELHLYPRVATVPTTVVSGASDAVLRLVYGRNRPDDGLQVEVEGRATVNDLRALFPGY